MTSPLQVIEAPTLPRHADGRVSARTVARTIRQTLGPDHAVEVLETAPDAPGTVGWSYATVRRIGRLTATGPHVGLQWAGLTSVDAHDLLADGSRQPDPLAGLDRVSDRLGLVPDAPRDHDLPAFTGGWVGVLGHDLARVIERLPDRLAASPDPDVDLRLVDTVLAWHPERGRGLLLHRPMGAPAPDLAPLVAALARARPQAKGPPVQTRAVEVARSSMGRQRHRRAVERVLAHIAAGDAFQVNVTHQVSAPWRDGPWSLYRALRDASPAAYGAVIPDLAGTGHSVTSVSPETFLEADGRTVRVRPIKGTRPRHPDDADADQAAAGELAASRKDQAENVMVVDMERNDLGRVCEVGSVRVPRLLEIERHPTVWHLVSTVEGRMRADVGWGDLLRATFPCGSVTGTPKVRALQLIEEIETVRRGVYCGAIGFLSAGAAHTSVAIRTAVLRPQGSASYGAGGGIVADSDPDAEWHESLDKAEAFLRATGSRLAEDDR